MGGFLSHGSLSFRWFQVIQYLLNFGIVTKCHSTLFTFWTSFVKKFVSDSYIEEKKLKNFLGLIKFFAFGREKLFWTDLKSGSERTAVTSREPGY